MHHPTSAQSPKQDNPGFGGPVVTPQSKVRPPAARLGQIRRSRLLKELSQDRTELVLVLAPAGFGKTVLISQWAADAGRPVAWATVANTDADAVVLMSTVLAAVSACGAQVVVPAGALTSDEPAFSRRVLPQFQRSLEQLDRPVTLVVDDVHEMAGVRAAVVLSAVLESLPAGSQLALVGRSRPDLPIALWRSQARLCELGPEELAFDTDEATEFLAELIHEEPSKAFVADTLEATGGWPVAVYLQGLASARRDSPPPIPSAALTDYLDSVVMAGADPGLIEFLRRSAILPTLSTSQCDDVLAVTNSRDKLRSAETATLLVSRLDGPDEFYRLHPLLRERLAQDLSASDPDDFKALHARAARWCDDRGYVEESIGHAAHSGDRELFGWLVWKHAPAALIVGRYTTVRGWLAHVDDATMTQTPTLAITAAYSALLRADGPTTVRWAEVTASLLGADWQNRLDRSTVEPALALLLALPGNAGFEASAALAAASHQALPTAHPLRALGLLINGAYLVLIGQLNEGRAVIERSRDLAQSMNLGTTWVGSSTMLAVLDLHQGAWSDADHSIAVARRVWVDLDLDDVSTTAWMSAVSGYLYARAGRERQARAELQRVEMMVGGLGPLLGWLHVLVQSFVARSWSLLGDTDAAIKAANASHVILERLPSSDFLSELVALADEAIGRSEILSRLTPAELRLWPFVLGRATLREIAVDLQLSPETVKSELRSIYRKVGVASRRELQDLAESPLKSRT